MDKYYDVVADSYDELYGEEQLEKAKIIKKEILKKINKGKLLDIGGGTGISTEIFMNKFKCYLIDPSEKLLEKVHEGINKKRGKAEEIPFNKKFDVIISLTSLHHADLKEALEEIKRVSHNKTLVVVSFMKKSVKLDEFRMVFMKEYNNAREIKAVQDVIFLNF